MQLPGQVVLENAYSLALVHRRLSISRGLDLSDFGKGLRLSNLRKPIEAHSRSCGVSCSLYRRSTEFNASSSSRLS